MARDPPEHTHASRSLGERLADVLQAERQEDGETPLDLARARAFDALFRETPAARNLGRYVVLERVGAGAMGVVYAAWDAELDRKVALKLLRGGLRDGQSVAGQRLVREAQALAKLSHPNVVTVHDAGTFEGHSAEDADAWAPVGSTNGATPSPPPDRIADAPALVFIAMEFVEGETLRRWLGQTPRPWREILGVLVEAGRGLAAAHKAGLVHRDFKPDNVMVAPDGRARVMDFGLVRPIESTTVTPEADAYTRPQLDALALPMTRAGATVGTPLYMAPEQLRADGADARSDQFAFCVTAWESLFGVRPYEGRTLLELAANVLAGRRTRGTGRRVPQWLRRVLDRGLDADPARRWTTMEELLGAVARGQRRAGLSRWIAIAATVLALVGGVVGAKAIVRVRAVARCAEEGASIADVWNDEAREQLRAGLIASGVNHAATTFEQVAAEYDQGVAEWAAAWTEACVRTDVDHSWDSRIGTQAIGCLESQRRGYAVLLERLIAGEPALCHWAMTFAERITDRGRGCFDPAALAMRMPLPDSEPLRTQVIELADARWDVYAAELAGDYPGAFAQMQQLVAEAEALGYAPLITNHRIAAATEAVFIGALEDAQRLAMDGYFEAASTGRHRLAAVAALTLVSVGRQRSQVDVALEWADHTEVHLRRLRADSTVEDAADLAFERGHLELARGDIDAAEREFTRSLELTTARLGASSDELARPLFGLAAMHEARGDFDATIDAMERALALTEAATGPDHPRVAQVLWQEGHHLLVGDRAEEAHAVLERALEIYVHSVPRVEDNIANLRIMVAKADISRGDLDEAEQHLLRALEYAAAGPEAASTRSYALVGLARLRVRQGRPVEARAAGEEAVQLAARVWGRESVESAEAEAALGDACFAADELDRSVEHLEHARAVYAGNHLGPSVASVEFQLAKALWRDGGDPPRARALVESAAATFAEHENGDALAEVQAWLAAHEVPR